VAAKNAVKRYRENGFYHIYNRGVAGNPIFFNQQDYGVFLHYLKDYLSPPRPVTPEEIKKMGVRYQVNNYFDEIELVAFCLMPNHFHLLLKQLRRRSIVGFMHSLLIRYSQYVNKTHQRVGHLYQGVYKGILAEQEEYLWWLSRYIHRNPIELLGPSENLADYPYSSYATYLGLKKIAWVKPEIILGSIKDYRGFTENSGENPPAEFPVLTLE
jgi:putative transposase